MSTIPTLSKIPEIVGQDPGLLANTSAEDIAGGMAAAELMNGVIAEAIAATGVNEDGLLTTRDLRLISRHIRSDDELYEAFVEGHGDDDGDTETGFHLVQGDGGTLKFQGRAFVDTIADAIYHVGFRIEDGRFLNEDGNANERVDDVAGWLNYFVNGVNVVYGSSSDDVLYSGEYSDLLADAANETFRAGRGDDKIWAGDGDDTVYAGAGDDVSATGEGDDTIYGGRGADKLYGQQGNDVIHGGAGDDVATGDEGDDELHGGGGADKLWAGAGNDTVTGGSGADVLGGAEGNDMLDGGAHDDKLWAGDGDDELLGGHGNDTLGGGAGNDSLDGGGGHDMMYGNEGDDVMSGGGGHDTMYGSDGDDTMDGGNGRDEISGGGGMDVMSGGRGRDILMDWEGVEVRDVFVFATGDTGRNSGTADEVRGFTSGVDQIDLSAWDTPLTYTEETFAGTGAGEVRYNGDYILIDADGNGRHDAMIKIAWVSEMQEADFIL